MAEGDFLEIARDVLAEFGIGWNGHGPETALYAFPFTDLGNGERLASLFGGRIHYCHAWRAWLIWDDVRWCTDDSGAINRLAAQTVRSMYREAGTLIDRAKDWADRDEAHRIAEIGEKLSAWARKSEARARLDSMIALAQSVEGIPVSPLELDTDPWLLNCTNGTANLRTGELQDHSQSDLITKLAPVAYEPRAAYGPWDDFLERILPDATLRSFVQRAIGYSLTGVANEERLFFVYGPTATGKSTLLRAVTTAMGDYAATANFGTFLEANRKGGDASEDLARLAGKRLVVSIEVEEGSKMAEAVLLSVTGGEEIAARFLHQNTFQFIPQFTLWLAANNRPRISDTNDAVWRRITQVPFETQIPENERDEGLKAILTDLYVAGPAVLAWAMAGCLAWQTVGLQIPDVVNTTTQDYRDEVNPILEFVQDCCVLLAAARVPNNELWERYNRWAKETSVRRPLGKKGFSQRLAMLAEVVAMKSGSSRFWQGIGLTENEKLL